jgi:hypothetical protein
MNIGVGKGFGAFANAGLLTWTEKNVVPPKRGADNSGGEDYRRNSVIAPDNDRVPLWYSAAPPGGFLLDGQGNHPDIGRGLTLAGDEFLVDHRVRKLPLDGLGYLFGVGNIS